MTEMSLQPCRSIWFVWDCRVGLGQLGPSILCATKEARWPWHAEKNWRQQRSHSRLGKRRTARQSHLPARARIGGPRGMAIARQHLPFPVKSRIPGGFPLMADMSLQPCRLASSVGLSGQSRPVGSLTSIRNERRALGLACRAELAAAELPVTTWQDRAARQVHFWQRAQNLAAFPFLTADRS